ncbi:hypothetical protein RI129_009690 [Pyrocoelia pectoralis]|uniref:Kynurenine formamidase n=1 Tax=Pyrocoelia pectoralis TaxID=417401 RepID=A0AAN7V6L1_9COLE
MKKHLCCIFSFIFLNLMNRGESYHTAIDLTWPFNNKTISYGDGRRFELTKKTIVDTPDLWYRANEYASAEHAGTHMDAPAHFDVNGWKIDEIPISYFLTAGIKIDLSNETMKYGSDARLKLEHIFDWQRRYGPIPYRSIMLIYFNWGQYYHDKLKYLGGETLPEYKFPGMTEEAATWIRNCGKVLGVGVDTVSIDPNNGSAVHVIILKSKMIALENVRIPGPELPARGFQLSVTPMYIEEGSGAPTRVIAYI